MKVAAIDIGSNSLRMLIAAPSNEEGIEMLGDFGFDARLGQGLSSEGVLDEKAVSQSMNLLKQMKRICDSLAVDRIQIVGTQVLRTAQNGDDFCKLVEDLFRVAPLVPSGEEEAAYSFLACHDVPRSAGSGHIVTADVGGGSTEVVVGRAGRVLEAATLPLGAVNVTERFTFEPSPGEDHPYVQMVAALEEELQFPTIAAHLQEAPFTLVGSGSTITTAMALHRGLSEYRRDEIHGRTLTPQDLFDWFMKLAHLDLEARAEELGFLSGRADILVPGLALWLVLCETLGAHSIVVSDNGLRHGMVREMLGFHRRFR